MKRILVVEDEQMLAEIITDKLKEEGYQVENAHNGEEGYNALSTGELPDLVLMDILMPKMTGFEILEKLKAEGKKMPKTIMFSNFGQEEDIKRAQNLGVIDYIVKAAFSPAEILGKIKAVFANDKTGKADSGTFDSMQEVKPMNEVLRPDEKK